jgi:Type VI secretion system (T6SS), amidase effector protein 4
MSEPRTIEPKRNTLNLSIPTYTQLLRVYQTYDIRSGTHHPCKRVDAGNNQCAYRLSVALGRCGFSLDKVPGISDLHTANPDRKCKCDMPHIASSEDLARIIKRFRNPSLTLYTNTAIKLHSQQGRKAPYGDWLIGLLNEQPGIVFLENLSKRSTTSAKKDGDHIDLFDGKRCYNEILGIGTHGRGSPTKTSDMFARAEKIEFWGL